jgi:hypothetical protein
MVEMSTLECLFHEFEWKEKEGEKQFTYSIMSTITISGSWLHHPTRYQVLEKKARGGFRMVAPSTNVANSGSVGGHAVQRNLNKDPALGFGGSIEAAKGSVISNFS